MQKKSDKQLQKENYSIIMAKNSKLKTWYLLVHKLQESYILLGAICISADLYCSITNFIIRQTL